MKLVCSLWCSDLSIDWKETNEFNDVSNEMFVVFHIFRLGEYYYVYFTRI